ncbi:30S ribosomal protein S19e [Thermoproteus tenax]|uniref:Small ribosomal subunit protein eS19 n=1 Tax=Thermoproteus tenax (strain ATCC 35583 / DSM 2078 / JCM 9277 / NBRC 100435 / Kra 1) TaxID=768679 RepID=G4RNV2_THETK|nr:30S ribosomal protein S19e [Thermoproteus tenax]CCC81246.1 Ribosomal protein S19e [Thermoproteus tenax Kra 1]
MVSVKDVPADLLIKELAEYLKANVPQVKPPVWSIYVKTGARKDRPPMQEDWWYIRAASIVRRLYLDGPVGLSSLRTYYGYRAKIGSGMRSEKTSKAGGAIIRKILHQLEQAGIAARTRKGRVLTPEGRSLVDRIATKIAKDLVKARPELAKYLAPPKE